jgi:pyruvate/2-oxoglutarate/acetoin dehydrogenase E1 component
VVEEGSCFAAIGSEIISSIAEMTDGDITARRISALPVPIPAVRSLEDMVLPGVDSIVEKIKESLK